MSVADILPPMFEQIMEDQGLTATHLRVWRCMIRQLDFVEPRPLKLDWLEATTGIDAGNLSRIVGRLIDRGYLVRDGRDGRTWRYRVPLARHTERAPEEPASDPLATGLRDETKPRTRPRTFSRGV